VILAIETSCDDTCAAVVTPAGQVRSNVVASQGLLHEQYGGVVPEIASRDHAKAIVPVVQAALEEAKMTLAELDGIAATSRPGLSGALLVGLQTAKGLAWASDKPLVAVDHLVGHLLAVFLRRPGTTEAPPAYPFVALLASGGHTAIYRVDGPLVGEVKELGATRDDAAGEAFDKVAKLLGLGYPGGPVVDKLAAKGDASRAGLVLPDALARKDSLEFSFSGLKSAMLRHVEKTGPLDARATEDLCAAFQAAVVKALVVKTVRAAVREEVPRVVLAGGVAANRGLRASMKTACDKRGFELFVPTLANCTDNAAMIAYAGAVRLAAGERDALDVSPSTRTSLPRVTRKGGGLRAT
jgi:N6-L-threonylcarbamoyladenine synthase